ncbi:expressed unknown protein [Seminavis robusta]|uniref:Uncharacterized protein n=1 Tax=Seminavis robusta TaxID=568900 RepID=A0A9N8E1H4_9STRA|nr:expressed unknown protein [Seminavis robusta]|eukprot:Sro553_g165270.1 n/a (294) ;mRNA; f:15599-16480
MGDFSTEDLQVAIFSAENELSRLPDPSVDKMVRTLQQCLELQEERILVFTFSKSFLPVTAAVRISQVVRNSHAEIIQSRSPLLIKTAKGKVITVHLIGAIGFFSDHAFFTAAPTSVSNAAMHSPESEKVSTDNNMSGEPDGRVASPEPSAGLPPTKAPSSSTRTNPGVDNTFNLEALDDELPNLGRGPLRNAFRQVGTNRHDRIGSALGRTLPYYGPHPLDAATVVTCLSCASDVTGDGTYGSSSTRSGNCHGSLPVAAGIPSHARGHGVALNNDNGESDDDRFDDASEEDDF